MRDVTFCPGLPLRRAVNRFVRRTGRLRLALATEVGKLALFAARGLPRLNDTITDSSAWRHVVETFFKYNMVARSGYHGSD
jgi:hypothetical protein